MMAEGELGEQILGVVKYLSKPYGTEITIRDNVGTVKL